MFYVLELFFLYVVVLVFQCFRCFFHFLYVACICIIFHMLYEAVWQSYDSTCLYEHVESCKNKHNVFFILLYDFGLFCLTSCILLCLCMKKSCSIRFCVIWLWELDGGYVLYLFQSVCTQDHCFAWRPQIWDVLFKCWVKANIIHWHRRS